MERYVKSFSVRVDVFTPLCAELRAYSLGTFIASNMLLLARCPCERALSNNPRRPSNYSRAFAGARTDTFSWELILGLSPSSIIIIRLEESAMEKGCDGSELDHILI